LRLRFYHLNGKDAEISVAHVTIQYRPIYGVDMEPVDAGAALKEARRKGNRRRREVGRDDYQAYAAGVGRLGERLDVEAEVLINIYLSALLANHGAFANR
jgi:hypothetical protein